MLRNTSTLLIFILILSSCNKKIDCSDGHIDFGLYDFTKAEKDTVIINVYQSNTLIQSDTNYCSSVDSKGVDVFNNIDSIKVSKNSGNTVHYTSFRPYTGKRCEIILPIINRKYVLDNISTKLERQQLSGKKSNVCFNKYVTYTLDGIIRTSAGDPSYYINLPK